MSTFLRLLSYSRRARSAPVARATTSLALPLLRAPTAPLRRRMSGAADNDTTSPRPVEMTSHLRLLTADMEKHLVRVHDESVATWLEHHNYNMELFNRMRLDFNRNLVLQIVTSVVTMAVTLVNCKEKTGIDEEKQDDGLIFRWGEGLTWRWGEAWPAEDHLRKEGGSAPLLTEDGTSSPPVTEKGGGGTNTPVEAQDPKTVTQAVTSSPPVTEQGGGGGTNTPVEVQDHKTATQAAAPSPPPMATGEDAEPAAA